MEELIKELTYKRDSFIGNQRDQVSAAEARGFKKGLSWAIDSAETILSKENEKMWKEDGL